MPRPKINPVPAQFQVVTAFDDQSAYSTTSSSKVVDSMTGIAIIRASNLSKAAGRIFTFHSFHNGAISRTGPLRAFGSSGTGPCLFGPDNP